MQEVANLVKELHMELNVTKENIPFCRALLKSAVGFCNDLHAEIKSVKKLEGGGGKKTTKKSSTKKVEKAAPVKKASAKKASAKKVEKAAPAKKAPAKKAAAKTDDGKRVTLKERVRTYLAANKTAEDLWSPKDLMKSPELEGTESTPLNQVLNQLIEAEEISRVSRGSYKLL